MLHPDTNRWVTAFHAPRTLNRWRPDDDLTHQRQWLHRSPKNTPNTKWAASTKNTCRWPACASSGQLQFVIKTHALLGYMFQEELLEMYQQTGAGKPPALLAMATRLQVYRGVADQEAVELTADSKRWQLVLGCLGADEPLFSQGALFDCRMRLLSTGMERR